jgi:orotate phosphoribosyltransferase
MEEFNQEEFNKFIEENGVYGFFEEAITLKSGRQSHFYANWRNVVEDVFLTNQLADYVVSFAKSNGLSVDTFYGVPEGATKLGIITQDHWAKQNESYAKGSHVLAMGRAKPKDHGAAKDKYFVGMPKGNVVVIEDVTTTGGSLLTTLNGLKEAGINIIGVISLTNRMEKRDDGLSVKEAVEQKGFKFYNMSSSLELLPLVYKKLQPGDQIASEIEKEFKEYGVEELKF